MDKVISFFKNKWTKLGFSALSLGYGFFMIWLAWLSFSFYLVPVNPVSLFSLFLLINVLFGTVMIYTRKEIATKITACILHPCILVMLVFAFGNWFLLIPVFAVSSVVFFASGSSESLKTILGTIYLILFVLTTLGYMTLQIFSIKVFDIDLELRSPREDYQYSYDKTYRLVTYTDKENKENRTISYYVEFTPDDLKLPFLDCERYANSKKILIQRLSSEPEVYWLVNEDDRNPDLKNIHKLYVDGKIIDVSVDDPIIEDDDDDEYTGETGLYESSPPTPTTAQTPPPDIP
ncbi:MAG: hypothetical protein FWG44_08400 [Oscillospiraceae bacterium]|nr:hypothetical protein [Oscillospiraceae bacterium]